MGLGIGAKAFSDDNSALAQLMPWRRFGSRALVVLMLTYPWGQPGTSSYLWNHSVKNVRNTQQRYYTPVHHQSWSHTWLTIPSQELYLSAHYNIRCRQSFLMHWCTQWLCSSAWFHPSVMKWTLWNAATSLYDQYIDPTGTQCDVIGRASLLVPQFATGCPTTENGAAQERPSSDGSARVGRIKLSISDIADGFGNARVDK